MSQPYDFIGIGIGPFNLSIAALSSGIPGFNTLFLERASRFSWHEGILLPECHMQTSFLKDLVSAVDPTSPYSFLNYLVKRKKFYRFLTTEQRTVSREEFADYLSWAANNLDSLQFGEEVIHVTFDDQKKLFQVTTQNNQYLARHVCMGIGKRFKLPECVKIQNNQCFHAGEMMLRTPDLTDKRVTVVGGGQSGADLFLNIFRGEWGTPKQLNWVSRRNNYNALDEAAFSNEYFTPEYVESFYSLEPEIKKRMLEEQKMTSDGITSHSLLSIYQAMYHRFEVLRETPWVKLLPSRALLDVKEQGESYQLVTQHLLDNGKEYIDSDTVIFATGYQPSESKFLEPLMQRLHMTQNGGYQIAPDFTLGWDGPDSHCLFAVNAGMQSHGIAEPQMSLMAWRSAHILNRALGKNHFDLSHSPGVIKWRSESTTQPFFSAF
ncbi:lysine N(6)-hydroxylase/L-ornithine N(5)-oxygenase family protein [Xenorhabdus szentirmaii]|uniref:L-lysine 6-monooxygenase n=1 Tax=Xenorhabdus szentirmaii DSM 16338 TaxID=1427518 RepID=W1J0M7_9GAMM|nr:MULTISPECIES: SidA/IucD/PvdA family monooxygenase [Xenorhabdus]MBD2780153.1 SidA/IucD/PvdA family monooxygenase [Xenorhabdus sp. 38]MBD2793668.1 SidA/IucD/PvdA family monooxygenase [Xenorhabdus sp. CUL]MBD2819967.1 SidA/IucD/PvdA family monooxygenase [Xenorhabdus sp. 42]MBD2826558.1 SidA/IucD/PvdA family monooxygenase [Xenorhabdus sp. 5]PHM31586.1 lysine:N6-hydroxylase [Xenorhabdus szentirmaii DSM 16338]